MGNNFLQILLVPEIALAILTSICLLYGLFSKKNSYVRTTNLALISLMLIPFLVFFNPTTNFAYYNELFTNSSFIQFFKILVIVGSLSTIIISKKYFLNFYFSKIPLKLLLDV